MKKLGKLFNLMCLGFVLAGSVACSIEEEEEIILPQSGDLQVVTGSITSNTTWKATDQYLLSGFVYVEAGVTLTIEPGTIIKGDKNSKGALIIKPGAKIIAVGTKELPIVFTSNQPAGQRRAGDWGGLVILGNAPVNKMPAVVEGEEETQFGGANPTDNSGELKYIRIEFAGIAYAPNKEINSITFGGVGSSTKVEFIQASFGGDDSFEWFGGTVNAKHLVSYRGLDDDFDSDNGFSGHVQFGLILRDPTVADQAGDSNGFESDNDANGTTANPQTSATFANFTVAMADGNVDSKFASAMRIRRNSAINVYNSVFTGAWPRSGLRVENDLTIGNFTAGTMRMNGVILATTAPKQIEGITEEIFKAAGNRNVVISQDDLKLAASFNALGRKPTLLPQSGSILLTAGADIPTGLIQTAYAGAFATEDWTEGWTNWDPQYTDYELKK